MSLTALTSMMVFDEPPLTFQPTFAKLIGLNNSIIFQQLHYWLRKSPHIIDGKPWIYNSYPDWHRQFPFWSERTIRTHIRELEKIGVVIPGNHNKVGFDRTKWYTIDYVRLDSYCWEQVNKRRRSDEEASSAAPSGEGCQIEVTPPSAPFGEGCLIEAAPSAEPIPETNSKTLAETITENNDIDPTPPNADAHVKIWSKCLEVLQTKISKSQYYTWLEPIKAVAYDEDTKTLSIQPKDKQAEDWIVQRFSEIILETLKQLAKGTRINLKIIPPVTDPHGKADH